VLASTIIGFSAPLTIHLCSTPARGFLRRGTAMSALWVR